LDNVSVTATITNPDGTAVTFDAIDNYTLFRGSTELHTSTGVTGAAGVLTLTGGIPAASLPATEALTDDLIEVWTATVAGQVHTWSRPVYLVRQLLNPCITDTDLTAIHSDLLDHIDPDQTTFETQRSDAWVMLNKWLIQKGNRPQLILDDWMLRDVHRYLALFTIAADFASSLGDGRWRDLAHGNQQTGQIGYLAKAESEFGKLTFKYDFDEDGKPDDGDSRAAVPVVFLQEPRDPWGCW